MEYESDDSDEDRGDGSAVVAVMMSVIRSIVWFVRADPSVPTSISRLKSSF